MSGQSKEGDELSKLNVTQLAQAYVGSVQAAEATEHVGRKNRFARRRAKIVEELKARGEAHSILKRLTGHSNERVREWATGNLTWLDKRSTEPSLERGPFWARILWQCDNRPPRALTRDEIAERLRQSVPEFCDHLMGLALPAIGLWPVRRTEIPAAAFRRNAVGATGLAMGTLRTRGSVHLIAEAYFTDYQIIRQLFPCCVLQDRDHVVNRVIDCRSDRKIYFLLRIFPPSIRMAGIAHDLIFAVAFIDAPRQRAARKGRP
jgi:hypothetical protein